jgi:hypothetical protein
MLVQTILRIDRIFGPLLVCEQQGSPIKTSQQVYIQTDRLTACCIQAAQISPRARWKFFPRTRPILSRLYLRRTSASVRSKIFLG